jgi:hypothetical protein
LIDRFKQLGHCGDCAPSGEGCSILFSYLADVKQKDFAQWATSMRLRTTDFAAKRFAVGASFAPSLQNFLDIGLKPCHDSRRFAKGWAQAIIQALLFPV